MRTPDVVFTWERLPEYRSTQQFGRCVGRILVTLPFRVRHRLGRSLTHGAVLIAQGIAGANADMPPGETLSRADRETFRSTSLEAVEMCRDALRLLKSERLGSMPDVMVGLALLDRIEAAVRCSAAPMRPDQSGPTT